MKKLYWRFFKNGYQKRIVKNWGNPATLKIVLPYYCAIAYCSFSKLYIATGTPPWVSPLRTSQKFLYYRFWTQLPKITLKSHPFETGEHEYDRGNWHTRCHRWPFPLHKQQVIEGCFWYRVDTVSPRITFGTMYKHFGKIPFFTMFREIWQICHRHHFLNFRKFRYFPRWSANRSDFLST